MGNQDARSPPGVCDQVGQVLRNAPDSRDLRDFADVHPERFVLLLHHARTCPTCRQLIDQAFPEGFVTPAEAKQLEQGLADAEQLLKRDEAERASAHRAPKVGDAGTEPRGDG